MKRGQFTLVFLLMLVAQALLNNYFGLARYVLISVLPVLILMLPHRMGTIVAMLVAFASGLAVDFFSTGMLGISSLALVPVALVRGLVLNLVFGEEYSSRDEELSLDRFGLTKMALAILILSAMFFLVYIWADSAGTVGFWPAALRWLLSVIVSTPVCVYVSTLLRRG
jgi:hypothetical protein